VQLNWENEYDYTTNVIGITLFVFILLYPIGITGLLHYAFNTNQFDDKEFLIKYSSLYYDTRFWNKSTINFTFIFCLRRIILTVIAVTLYDYPLFQCQLNILSNLFAMMYFAYVQPYDSKLMNCVEIFNEFCILMVSYTMILFAGILDDVEQIYSIGWMVILFVLFNILANMVVVTIQIIRGVKFFIRQLRWRCKNFFGELDENNLVEAEHPQSD